MKQKLKILITSIATLSLVVVFALAMQSYRSPSEDSSDEQKISELIKRIQESGVDGLSAREIDDFDLPSAGIDVMRVQIEETYNIYGVGTETVQLSGWIAVKHDNPKSVDGVAEVTWDESIIPTEFVAMELKGNSELFGPVTISLDPSQPSIGQVGGEINCDINLYKMMQSEGHNFPPMPVFDEWK